MTLAEFRTTLQNPHPPAMSPALCALWHAGKGNWDEAHKIAQDIDDASGAWVHAHLHRVEGDLGNARYWYRQARQPEATDALDVEWMRIVTAVLRD